MPLHPNAPSLITGNLSVIASGSKAGLVSIGYLTDFQFAEINRLKISLGLPPVDEPEIVFFGAHIHKSRILKDRYTIQDVIDQIASALSDNSLVDVGERITAIQNHSHRSDRLGNTVLDRGIFEIASRKPKIELFSVIPKGDWIKP